MPAYHCKVCGVAVANYADALEERVDHYCSVHHPDPEHRVVDEPPTRMTVRLASTDDPLKAAKDQYAAYQRAHDPHS